MLVSLSVKNLALIDQTEVNFTEGLNILSGETGAGKSIIIGSVTLALGAKADSDMIRTGAEYALIELTFQSFDRDVKQCMEEMELPVEEDGSILISRKLQQNRSVFRINGETATIKQIRSLSELLMDIHGQHDHQSLLHREKHLEILDSFAEAELKDPMELLRSEYHELKKLEKEYQETMTDDSVRVREMDLAQFEITEISEAALKDGEDILLEKKYQRMVNSRRILEAVGLAATMVETEDTMAMGSQIDRALRELRSVSGYDEKLQELETQLEQIDSLLMDFGHGISGYMESMEFDEEDFRLTEERLNVINHLKAKYGSSIEAVKEYLSEKEERLEKLEHYEMHRRETEHKIEQLRKLVLQECEKVSGIRKKASEELSGKLRKALTDLNFLHVEFNIDVRPQPEAVTARGYDDVEFMISTNPGEPLRPLHMVASGGELSRIMLALKTVIADRDAIETLIFDEIDSGISGKTAWKVSEKLGELAREHQIICITHLPQIAAMADTHFYIEKSTDGSSTVTSITKIEENARIQELARMLGGSSESPAALENAKELILTAEKSKAAAVTR
jgi:DNA repair protein RecN (Recombination protein N)